MKSFSLLVLILWPWFILAADPPTLTELDRAIMRPPPFPRKWETNLTNLATGASKGDASMQCDLASHYIFAVGTTQDLAKAVYWFTKSANQNFLPAQYALGILYKNGVGVASNQTAADSWFQKAASKGYAPAEHEAALAADRNGKRAVALKLLGEAAEKGFPSSEYLMGCIASNSVDRYVWYSLSAPYIEIAGTRQLELQQEMTKEQLTEAEHCLRKIQRKQGDQLKFNGQ